MHYRHTPEVQTRPAGHTFPQAPQLFVFVDKLTQMPEHKLNPELHAIAHTPAPLQTRPAPQKFPQVPQLLGLVVILISQPSPAKVLQFLKPALHAAKKHDPPLQVAEPFAKEHTFPQAPQLAALVLKITSQPSAALALQFSKPALQEIVHVPPVHKAEAFVRGGQTFPHVPQLLVLVLILISQPSAELTLQFAKPELQDDMEHEPPVQPAVAFATEHRLPQAPQLLVLVFILISQPSDVIALQFAKPVLQAEMAHAPPVQTPEAFAKEHTFPQEPQLLISVWKKEHIVVVTQLVPFH